MFRSRLHLVLEFIQGALLGCGRRPDNQKNSERSKVRGAAGDARRDRAFFSQGSFLASSDVSCE
jgi:hypothetical protein